MKAPKLLLALGLSVPTLVQSLSEHHGDQLRANAHLGERNSDGSSAHVEAQDHESFHDGSHFKRQGAPLPLDILATSTHGKRDEAADNAAPPKTRCNAIAPFCSHSGSSAEHGKREFDTAEAYHSTQAQDWTGGPDPDSDSASDSPYHSTATDSDVDAFDQLEHWFTSFSDSKDAPKITWDGIITFDTEKIMPNALKCTFLSEPCEYSTPESCECKLVKRCSDYASINNTTWEEVHACLRIRAGAGNQRRTDEPLMSDIHDGSDTDAIKKAMECTVLHKACALRKRLCACNLMQRCTSDVSVITNSEFNICILGDGPHPEFADEIADDKLIRRFASSFACDLDAHGCGCDLEKQFADASAPGASWKAIETCYDSLFADDSPKHLSKRGDGSELETDSRYERAEELCRQGSKCACHFGRRCQREGSLSGRSLKEMRRCLHEGSPLPPRGGVSRTSQMHEGQVTTIDGDVYSISTTSPHVAVVTGDQFTAVVSYAQTDAPAMAVSGIFQGHTIEYTMPGDPGQGLDERDIQATRTLLDVLDDNAMTLLNGEHTTYVVSFDSEHTVAAQQYQKDNTIRLVQTPVGTPLSMAFSGVANGQPIRAFTVAAAEAPFAAAKALKSHIIEDDASLRKRGIEQESVTTSASESVATMSTTTVALFGNNSAAFFQATDAEGRPIYVTRTGDWAASTTTVTFSESFRPATATREGGIIEYRVITKTHTVDAPRCTPHRQMMLADKTIVDLGHTQVPYTGGKITVNGTAIHLAHAPAFPHATLAPFTGDLPDIDFQHTAYASVTYLTDKDDVWRYFNATKTVVEVNGKMHTMTSATQTIDGTPVVMHPLAQYLNYDARTHRVVPTPACLDAHGIYRWFGVRGKKTCQVEQCMWQHMRPMAIHTVFPGVMRDAECATRAGYFTQHTYLQEPHWGTTAEGATYYPATLARTSTTLTRKQGRGNGTATVHVRPTCVARHAYPVNYDPRHHLDDVQDDLPCFDMQSCHQYCRTHHGPGMPRPIFLALIIGLPLTVGIPTLALLCCCLPAWLLRRHRRNKAAAGSADEKTGRRASVLEKLRRGSSAQQPGAVVNAASGQAVDPATGVATSAGPGVATALVAGSAAGAAAAGSGGSEGKSNANGDGTTNVVGGAADEGKGTLGRQAEEGRSRVRFDDATAGEAPKAVPAEEPHVVTAAPPPKTDGTSESTGREVGVPGDVGSMRGRKRVKQGLDLAF